MWIAQCLVLGPFTFVLMDETCQTFVVYLSYIKKI